MLLGGKWNRCLDGDAHIPVGIRSVRGDRGRRSRISSGSGSSQALDLCLKGGIGRLQGSDAHGEVGQLGEKNGGVIDSGHGSKWR